MQILGRCNQMVKLRGQRVELSLVELALTSLTSKQLEDATSLDATSQNLTDLADASDASEVSPPIFLEAACCLVDRDLPSLVAAVVPSPDGSRRGGLAFAARKALMKQLPAVAVPCRLLLVPEIPRLPGGDSPGDLKMGSSWKMIYFQAQAVGLLEHVEI